MTRTRPTGQGDGRRGGLLAVGLAAESDAPDYSKPLTINSGLTFGGGGSMPPARDWQWMCRTVLAEVYSCAAAFRQIRAGEPLDDEQAERLVRMFDRLCALRAEVER